VKTLRNPLIICFIAAELIIDTGYMGKVGCYVFDTGLADVVRIISVDVFDGFLY